jgi:hypothetical protein
MSALKTQIAILIITLTFTLLTGCDKDEPKFGPPKMEEQRVADLPRDKDGWVTDKDVESWEKETTDPIDNIVMTKNEMKGMKLFMKHCNRCHPAGEKGKGPALNDKKLPDLLIHFQIRNGFGDMPAFKEDQISKEQVKQIISFVKLIRKNEKS